VLRVKRGEGEGKSRSLASLGMTNGKNGERTPQAKAVCGVTVAVSGEAIPGSEVAAGKGLIPKGTSYGAVS
jgi:hypothetical protein